MSAEIVQRVDSDVRLNRGRRPPPPPMKPFVQWVSSCLSNVNRTRSRQVTPLYENKRIHCRLAAARLSYYWALFNCCLR